MSPFHVQRPHTLLSCHNYSRKLCGASGHKPLQERHPQRVRKQNTLHCHLMESSTSFQYLPACLFIFIPLFMAVLGLHCCMGFSLVLASSRAEAPQLWCMSLGPPTACGIFLEQGLDPHLLHWQADSLVLSTREALLLQFLIQGHN